MWMKFSLLAAPDVSQNDNFRYSSEENIVYYGEFSVLVTP